MKEGEEEAAEGEEEEEDEAEEGEKEEAEEEEEVCKQESGSSRLDHHGLTAGEQNNRKHRSLARSMRPC